MPEKRRSGRATTKTSVGDEIAQLRRSRSQRASLTLAKQCFRETPPDTCRDICCSQSLPIGFKP